MVSPDSTGSRKVLAPHVLVDGTSTQTTFSFRPPVSNKEAKVWVNLQAVEIKQGERVCSGQRTQQLSSYLLLSAHSKGKYEELQ